MEKQADPWARIDELATPEKIVWFAKRIALAYLAIWTVVVMTGPGLADLVGRPKGTDFLTLYAAGSLTLKGEAHHLYSLERLQTERAELIQMPIDKIGINLWPYPPPYFFVAAAVAWLPYLLAYVLWVTLTLLIYARAIYLWSPSRVTLYVTLAAPAVFMNFSQGQSGFLMGAVLAYGLLILERRPFMAGAVLGILALKPQFALAPFLVLLVTGHWRAVAGGVACGAVMAVASIVTFGWQSWVDMVEVLPVSLRGISSGVFPFHKYATVLGFARLLSLPESLVWSLQLAATAAALAGVIWVWRTTGSRSYRAAAICTGLFLATPYAHDYDLAMCLPGVIVLGAEISSRGGGQRWEKGVLLGAYLMPVVAPAVAQVVRLQLMPVILGLLLWVIVRRVRLESTDIAPAP